MATPHSTTHKGHGGPEDHGGPQDFTTDDMDLGKIIIVGIVSLIIFAAGVWWAYLLLTGKEREIRAQGEARPTPLIGSNEIGIVDQVPFDRDRRLEMWRAEKKKRLSSYGWVDKQKGVAHIPIERAMEEVVAHPPDIPGQGVPPAGARLAPPPSGSQPAAPGQGVRAVPGKPQNGRAAKGRPGSAPAPAAHQPAGAVTPPAGTAESEQ